MKPEPITRVWQKWRFRAAQTHLCKVEIQFSEQAAQYKTSNSRTMSNKIHKIATLLKLFSALFKRNSANKEQALNTIRTEADEADSETSIEERPEVGQKNKWLYPADVFRKMEPGVVDSESKEVHKKGKKILFLD